MKKYYLSTILAVLLAVLLVAGCAPSWQPPLMGPDPVPNDKSAPVNTPESASRDDSSGQVSEPLPKPVVVAPTKSPTVSVQPPATPTAQAVVGEPATPISEPAPTTQSLPVNFQPGTTRTTFEGVLRP